LIGHIETQRRLGASAKSFDFRVIIASILPGFRAVWPGFKGELR
jgi:hypothetical protein